MVTMVVRSRLPGVSESLKAYYYLPYFNFEMASLTAGIV
jgi:hypothetical protein